MAIPNKCIFVSYHAHGDFQWPCIEKETALSLLAATSTRCQTLNSFRQTFIINLVVLALSHLLCSSPPGTASDKVAPPSGGTFYRPVVLAFGAEGPSPLHHLLLYLKLVVFTMQQYIRQYTVCRCTAYIHAHIRIHKCIRNKSIHIDTYIHTYLLSYLHT